MAVCGIAASFFAPGSAQGATKVTRTPVTTKTVSPKVGPTTARKVSPSNVSPPAASSSNVSQQKAIPPKASPSGAAPAKGTPSKAGVPIPAVAPPENADDDDEEGDDEEAQPSSPPASSPPASSPPVGVKSLEAPEKDRVPGPKETESELSFGGDLDLNSRYIWRGIALSKGGVLQPSTWASYAGFTALAWANVDLSPERGSFTNVTPMISYEAEILRLRIEPLLMAYIFPQSTNDSTLEAGLGLSYPIGPLRITSANHVDVARHAGAYFGTLGLEHQRTLVEGLDLRVFSDVGFATAGFNNAYLDTNVTAVNLVQAGVALKYGIRDWLFVSVHSEGSILVASSLRDWAANGTSMGGPLLANVGVTFGVER